MTGRHRFYTKWRALFEKAAPQAAAQTDVHEEALLRALDAARAFDYHAFTAELENGTFDMCEHGMDVIRALDEGFMRSTLSERESQTLARMLAVVVAHTEFHAVLKEASPELFAPLACDALRQSLQKMSYEAQGASCAFPPPLRKGAFDSEGRDHNIYSRSYSEAEEIRRKNGVYLNEDGLRAKDNVAPGAQISLNDPIVLRGRIIGPREHRLD